MNDQTSSMLLQQLAHAAPMLIVTLVGLILALLFIRKHTAPAILTILAFLAYWVTSWGTAFVQVYLVNSRVEHGWTTAQVTQMMALVSISGNIMRALAIALLLAAVFVGRRGKAEPRPITVTRET